MILYMIQLIFNINNIKEKKNKSNIFDVQVRLTTSKFLSSSISTLRSYIFSYPNSVIPIHSS